MRAKRLILAGFCALEAAFLVTACASAPSAKSAAKGGSVSPSVCPTGAARNSRGCSCGDGLLLLDGACVGEAEAKAFCGGSADGWSEVSGRVQCKAPVCAEGEALDPRPSVCLGAGATRALLAHTHALPEGERFGCRTTYRLVAHDDQARCLPRADACPRGTSEDPARASCAPMLACPPGEVGEVGAGRCVRLLSGDPAHPILDLGAWVHARLGSDGGAGTPWLCRPLAGSPWSFDTDTGGERTLRLEIALQVPNNDLTQLSATADVFDATASLRLPAASTRAVELALESLLLPLRAIGGTASAAAATTSVRCTIHGGITPLLLATPGPP